jgi:non-ribosomal peptide synthetase component F
VTIEHHNLSAFINALAQRIGFECHHSILALASPSFDMSVVELLMPLALGGCVVIPSKQQSQDSEALNTLIAETQPDVILATPAKWEMLLAERSLSLNNVTVLVGGEALPLSLARTLINAASVVWNCYGPTETTGCSIAGRVEPADIAQHKILLDNALSGYYHKVIDEYNNILPAGAIGELIIGGVGVGLGYWNNPELTASVFCRDIIEGECWYKTGDLVQQQIDGRFRFLGRSDHQVKIRGYRIELTEIEYQLQQYLGESTKCVVSTQPDGQGFLNLVGYICQDIIDTQAVEQALRIVLPDYMVPKQWMTLTELPLNANGKIERKKTASG